MPGRGNDSFRGASMTGTGRPETLGQEVSCHLGLVEDA